MTLSGLIESLVTNPQWAVCCDKCYRRGPTRAAQRGAKVAAMRAGWFVSQSAPVKDLCPDCCAEVSEQWMGLHHPDWHDSVGVRAWCRCGTWCSDGAACDCCELVELRAEVETLRAQVQAVRDVLGDVSNVYAPSGVSPLVNVSLILGALDGAR